MDPSHSRGHVQTLDAAFKLKMKGTTVPGPLLNRSVINLSQIIQLSPAQFQLLDKGLSFISSSSVKLLDKGSIFADLGRFHLKIQRAIYFGPCSDVSRARPFCAKSDWVPPPRELLGEIWDFFDKNFEDIQEIVPRAQVPPANLAPEEVVALKELSDRQDIINDQASAVVIMDRPQYLQEGLRQLGDESFYSKLKAPIFQDSIPCIKRVVHSLIQESLICQ